ncbi:MAG TPA: murein biosynthesis integral membrane protein MurJ [Symbiobacteriaceae bacterium]|nr:murein biosynthesis integral membrane protein MurJ [Symbiobacteriaceae bacterium]
MTAARGRSFIRAAGLVSLALIASRVLGYVRESLLAARFGATHTTDAYLVAQDLPTSLFASVSAALVMVVIPVYRSIVERRGEADGWRLINTIMNAAVLLAVVLIGLGWVLSPSIIPMLVPGLPVQAHNLAVDLTRVMLPMMFFLAVAGVSSAVLNANSVFTPPALMGFVSNVAVVGALFLVSGPEQIHWVAYAVVLGAIFTAAVQVPFLPTLGYRYRPMLDWRDPGLLQVLRLILPVILTTLAIQAQNFVDRYLASHLAEGSISALNYAVRVNSLPYGVVGAAVTTVLYPRLAELVARGDMGDLGRTVVRGLRMLSFVLLPMAVGLMVFREPVVQIFFQRGAFDPRATGATAFALLFYAAGILFFGWLDYLNRCFFALQDTVTPMVAAIGMVGLNIMFNLMLVGPLSHGGLALGTSLSTVVAISFLLWRLARRLGTLDLRSLLRVAGLNLATAMVGGLAGYISYAGVARFVSGPGLISQAIRLGVGLGVIVVVHVAAGLVTGSEEVAEARAELLRKLGRSRA